MSPEQVRGEDVSPASDVFSLGTLFFQMLTGRRPFPGRAWAAAMAIVDQPPLVLEELRPEIPSELAKVIRRCLEKEAARRYASAVELTAALEAARLASEAEVAN